MADLIITGRGGGSIEDLWAFNDERVARAIYASHIPVISAVGHEPDVTIADYVADARASTPSNAAEIAVPDCGKIREALESLGIRSCQSMTGKLSALSDRLAALAGKRVLTDPLAHIENRRMELDRVRDGLAAAGERVLAAKKQDFIRLASMLDAMSPLRVLSRGYAIASAENGKPVKSAKALSEGERLNISFTDGRAGCRVEKIEINS